MKSNDGLPRRFRGLGITSETQALLIYERVRKSVVRVSVYADNKEEKKIEANVDQYVGDDAVDKGGQSVPTGCLIKSGRMYRD